MHTPRLPADARVIRSFCGVAIDTHDGHDIPRSLVLLFDQVLLAPSGFGREILRRQEQLFHREGRLLAHALHESLPCALYEALIEALIAVRHEVRDAVMAQEVSHGHR
jgi:hypothetical protein